MSKAASSILLRIFNSIRFLCRVIGIDVLDEHYQLTFIAKALYGMISLYFFGVIYTIYSKFSEDWKIILEAMCMSGSVVQGCAKLTMAIVFSNELASLRINLVNMYKELEVTEKYGKILLNSINSCKLAIQLSLTAYIAALASIYLFPVYYFFVKNKKILPINFTLPIVDENTNKGFLFLYVLHGVLIFCGGLGNIVGDMAFILFSYSSTVYSDIFRQRIKDFNEQLKKHENNNIFELTNWLNTCLSYRREITTYFYWVVTLVIGTSCLGAIFSLFIVVSGDWPAAYANFVVNITTTYIFCFIGTAAENSADDLIEMIYEIEWYRLTVSDQKAVMFMLMMAQQKIVFSVGEVSPLTLNTALQVTKTIYSFYMMLTSFV